MRPVRKTLLVILIVLVAAVAMWSCWVIIGKTYSIRESDQLLLVHAGARMERIAFLFAEYVFEKRALPPSLLSEAGATGDGIPVTTLSHELSRGDAVLAQELGCADPLGGYFRIGVKEDSPGLSANVKPVQVRILSLARDRPNSILPHDDVVIVLNLIDNDGRLVLDTREPIACHVPKCAEGIFAGLAARFTSYVKGARD